MASSTKQDSDFLEKVVHANLPSNLLEHAVDWIGSNMLPEDVFPDKDLTRWAAGMEVDSIFPVSELEEWATNNGFVRG